jgi:transcriptional regulator with XRE-family HTH domain
VTGPELREERLRRGLTQHAMGAWLGVAENTVSQWERGLRRVPPWAVKRIRETQESEA